MNTKKSNGYFSKRRTLVFYPCASEVESRITVKGVLIKLKLSDSRYYD